VASECGTLVLGRQKDVRKGERGGGKKAEITERGRKKQAYKKKNKEVKKGMKVSMGPAGSAGLEKL